MYALLRKEFNSFFSGITGYGIVIIFLITTGLFLWIFPNEFNIPDAGYATLESFFVLAPWIFLFLIPAVSMRLLADEQKSGTLELLLTRPLTPFQIVLSKFIAGLSIVIFSLIPSLIYFLSVYMLSLKGASIDLGATIGAYIGLFFLSGIYVAIGLYASSLTDNQIIAFLLAVVLSFLFYIGFDALAGLSFLSGLENLISQLGINHHYQSVSRGVVDSRNLVYFISVTYFFLLLSRIRLTHKNRIN